MINKLFYRLIKLCNSYAFFLGVLCLILSLLYSFSFCFIGLDFTESFFYINSSRNIEDYPLWIGTSAIGKLVGLIFGEDLIYYRITNWVAFMGAAIFPYVALIPKDKWKSNLPLLALVICCLNVLSFNVFGIDGLTILFLSITSVFFIRYISNRHFLDLILSSFFTAILVSIRIPNIIVIPIFLFFLCLRETPRKRTLFMACAVYVFISLILLALGYVLVYEKLNFFSTVYEIGKQNLNGTHPFLTLLFRYVADFHILLKYFGFISLMAILVETNYLPAVFREKYGFLIKAVIFLLFFYFLGFEVALDPYAGKYSRFVGSAAIILIVHVALRAFSNDMGEKSLPMMLILALSIIPIAGSNTGLLRMGSFLIIFAVIVFVSSEVVFSKFTILLLLAFALFSVYAKNEYIVEDGPLRSLNTTVDAPKVRHIYTTPSRSYFIQNVMGSYDSLQTIVKDKIVFWGLSSHLFHYITSSKTGYPNSFWMFADDPSEISRFEQVIIEKRPIVFFTPQYPSETNSQLTAITPLDQMLTKHRYNRTVRANYNVYIPQH